MAPDLDSLQNPFSSSPSQPPRTMASTSPTLTPSRSHAPSPPTTSPVVHSSSPSHSLAAAAAMNAGMQTEGTRRASGESHSPSSGRPGNGSSVSGGNNGMRSGIERRRRRSSIRMNLALNDPAIPAPGEMQTSPATSGHARSPSLGEIYQEMESEQEAQVNRLLGIIRQQQTQIASMSAASPAVDDATTTPVSERSTSMAPSAAVLPPSAAPHALPRTRSPASTRLSRQSSYSLPPPSRHGSVSHTGSPLMRPFAGGEHEGGSLPGGLAGRDESAFYQAEAQSLTRENQMLRLRIRELERQVADTNPHASSPVAHSPLTSSALSLPAPASAEPVGAAAGGAKEE